MSCCPGNSGPTVVLTNRDRVRIRYRGDRAVTVVGPVTGLSYGFSDRKRTAVVDPRDALALLKTHLFRLEGVVRESADNP
jgi:hypothetical protein